MGSEMKSRPRGATTNHKTKAIDAKPTKRPRRRPQRIVTKITRGRYNQTACVRTWRCSVDAKASTDAPMNPATTRPRAMTLDVERRHPRSLPTMCVGMCGLFSMTAVERRSCYSLHSTGRNFRPRINRGIPPTSIFMYADCQDRRESYTCPHWHSFCITESFPSAEHPTCTDAYHEAPRPSRLTA
jgi:hypothetical protein